MPADEKVEKVARAIYEARGAHEPPRAWRKWEGIGDEARAVWCRCAEAALAAMGEREAVAADGMPATIWAGSCSALGAPDTGYWYPVRTPSTPTEYVRASPRPEAVGEAVKAEMAQPTNEKGAIRISVLKVGHNMITSVSDFRVERS